MATDLEIRERQKRHLMSLLTLKKANAGVIIKKLDDEIRVALTGMDQEDVAWVEKLAEVKAL